MTKISDLSERDVAALDRVRRVASERGLPLVLVGAGARLLRVDWSFGILSPRTTRDWDFAVEVPDFETYEQVRQSVADRGTPLKQDTVRVQVEGVSVDLLPFGAIESPDGIVRWSSMELDVCGMADAKAGAAPLAVTERLVLPVSTIPALAALKLIAFEGRGREDDKDLRDFHFIASEYLRCGNEDRLFDELAAPLAEGTLPFHRAGPFLLGRDIAHQCSPETLARVARVLARIVEDANRHAHTLFGPSFDDAAERREGELSELFSAVLEGVASIDAR